MTDTDTSTTDTPGPDPFIGDDLVAFLADASDSVGTFPDGAGGTFTLDKNEGSLRRHRPI